MSARVQMRYAVATMQRRDFAVGVLGLTLAPGCRLTPTGTLAHQRDPAPAFALGDHRGQRISLAQLHATGPAIVVFYRGFW